MASRTPDPLTERIIAFIREIGIPVERRALPPTTFLPGIHASEGALWIDDSLLRWPGDLLHEAGHIAITPPHARSGLTGVIADQTSNEMAAIAWSYAACVHLQLDPAVLFHPAGYGVDSARLIENFTEGRYFGVPLLQYLGMALEPATAARTGAPAYPVMMKWLCPRDGGHPSSLLTIPTP